MTGRTLLSGFAAVLLASAAAVAQPSKDVPPPLPDDGKGGATATSIYGAVDLQGGFLPDPHEVFVSVGGDVDAYEAFGEECWGFVTDEPTYVVNYSNPAGGPLFIYGTSENDTVLVVQDPNGNVICNDDGLGYPNPLVTVDAAPAGAYLVWFGSYSSDQVGGDGTLYVSEIEPEYSEEFVSEGLDYSLFPAFGEITLRAGFPSDPFRIDMTVGGPLSIADEEVGPGCYGFANNAPDFRVYYESGAFPLTFSVDAAVDTTLVIVDPNGAFICDDDSGGFPNPQLTFDQPMAGYYDIWVGVYSESEGVTEATLSISELGGPGGAAGAPVG